MWNTGSDVSCGVVLPSPPRVFVEGLRERGAVRRFGIARTVPKMLRYATTPDTSPLAPRLDLSLYPHLPTAEVERTSAADYLALLGRGAG